MVPLFSQRKESEADYFRVFKQACRTGDPDAILRQLMFWLDRFLTPGAATLEGFVIESQDPKLAEQARRLSDAVSANGDKPRAETRLPSGLSFYRHVARARKTILRKRVVDPPRIKSLPSLNPTD